MKKNLSLRTLALAALLALAAPASSQELFWNQYRGYDVPFVPTPPEVVDEMLRMAGVKSGDVLYDLGCGDGRIVIAAAKRFGIRAVGIDIDPVRITESTDNAAAAGLTGKVRFVQQDLFEADFRDATVVTMYLLTSVNLRLRPKLLADLRPGTRLVSHSFDMENWRPDRSALITTSFGDERDVHFWVVPANLTGRWQWDLPDGPGKRRYALEADQEFQVVTATATEGGFPLDVDDVVLSGDLIRFRVVSEDDGKMRPFLYEGKVLGDTIRGTVRPAGNPKAAPLAWKAARVPGTARSIAK
jgi:SAM-dependent methyltransferase